MNKKGLIFRLIIYLIVIILIILIVIKFTKADIATNIINITFNITTTDIFIDFSNTTYKFNNTPSIINLTKNFDIYFQPNITNVTVQTNFTCTNTTVSVSCSCPSIECPLIANCSIPNEIDLPNATKQDLYNHYITNLQTKIEESSNKVAQDILFQLQPTTAQLDNCKQAAINASSKEQEAYRQRDKIASDNVAISSVAENCRDEKRTLQLVFWFFIGFVFIAGLSYYGFIERMGKLW